MTQNMEVFEWVRHVLDTKTPSIEFESILVLLVNYGATSDQKYIRDFLTKSSPLAHVLTRGHPEMTMLGLRCIGSLASRKLVPKENWEWCYTVTFGPFSEALAVFNRDMYPFLHQCLKTLTSLVSLQPPSGTQFFLTQLRQTLTHGMFSVPLSRTGSRTSGDEVSSDEEGVLRQPVAQLGTSSDSEASDSEYSANLDLKSRAWAARIRLQSYQCLYSLLHAMDRKEVFSYWSMFLSTNNSEPSVPTILTCLVKESSSKVRMTIAMTVSALLEGTKSLLSAADDRPLQSCAFIPYSHWLGGILRDIHRVLLLAASTEANSKTLLQILKCISTLLANVPYGRLSEPYQTRMASSLKPLLAFRNVDVRVACFTSFNSMLSNECGSDVKEWISRSVSPTLPEVCMEQLPSHSHPQVIQIAALQMLASLAKHHPHSLLGVFHKLIEQLVICADVPELSIHVFQVMEEFWKSRQNDKDLMTTKEACCLWSGLLEGPISKHLQGSHHPSISSCCDLLATIGSDVMGELKQNTCVFILSMILGVAKHDTPQIQASAVRTLGVYVQYSNLQADVSFLVDATHIICLQAKAKELPIRVQAAWSLGNLCDSLRDRDEILTAGVYSQLLDACLSTCKDHERVRVNSVRALGHLLHGLQSRHLSILTPKLPQCVDFLSKTISSGAAKIRWNGCHATANALSSKMLLEHFSVDELIATLTKTLYTCKNFKVRVSAVSAICCVPTYSHPMVVWEGLIQAIKASEEMKDFSEFKHQSTLQSKLCDLFHHLIQSTPDEVKEEVDKMVTLNKEHIAAFAAKLKPFEESSEESGDNELAKLKAAAGKASIPSLLSLFS